MRVMGVNAIAVLAAGLAFWILGFIWYGLAFSDIWLAGHRLNEAEVEASNPAWMGLGFVISFVTAAGLAIALHWGGLPDLLGAVKRSLVLWTGLGLTAALYSLAYLPQHSVGLFLVDASYTLVGWSLAAAIIALLR